MTEVTKTTLKRIGSAIVALPIYAFAIITDSLFALPILLISTAVSLMALYEFYNITSSNQEVKPFIKTGLFAGLGVNIIMYLLAYGKVYLFTGRMSEKYIMGFIVLFIVFVLIFQVFARPIKESSRSISLTIFGVLFIVFFFSHIILMKSLADGVFYLIMLNVVIMCNDSGAYFGGVLFGKHKVGFEVSPNKTWEGYFSGLLFSVLSMILINQLYASFFSRNFFNILEATILGVIISVLANIGDLIESVVKRDNAIKDSGSIIPGHGGMWDVFDAILFTLPVFYYYLLLIKGVH